MQFYCWRCRARATVGLPGKSPALFLCFNINFALCVAVWSTVLGPAEAWLFLWSQDKPYVLCRRLDCWESWSPLNENQSALWFPFGSLSFAFFPWKSCVGWRRPWCGVRRNLDATKPEQSDLFPDVLNGNWVVPYWNLYLYSLWAGNLQLADTHLISGLQLSSGYLRFFQVWVCFKSSSSLFLWVQVAQNSCLCIREGQESTGGTIQASSGFSA